MPKRLDPRDIRFTHDSVHGTFDDGRRLEDALNELKDGKCNVEKIPRITVVRKDGMIFSLNNRRLWVFREYAKFLEKQNNGVLEVPVKFGTTNELNFDDMTTINEGENLEVMPNGSEKYDINTLTVRLSDVLYCTDKLYRFSKSVGHYQRSTIDDDFDIFSANVHETKLLPVLKVVKRKGQLHALDNKQLWLLQQWHLKNPGGHIAEDKTITQDCPGVDTVNSLDTNHQNESPGSRKRNNKEVSGVSQSVEGETCKADKDREIPKEYGAMKLDRKNQHDDKNGEDLNKHHVETGHLNHGVLDSGDSVRVELRPYKELAETFRTTDEGHSIQIVWDEPKKIKEKKYKPLTRQKPSQEKKDLVKYSKCYENQSKRSSRR